MCIECVYIRISVCESVSECMCMYISIFVYISYKMMQQSEIHCIAIQYMLKTSNFDVLHCNIQLFHCKNAMLKSNLRIECVQCHSITFLYVCMCCICVCISSTEHFTMMVWLDLD